MIMIKRDSQNAKLLSHLAKGRPLTRLKAFHIFHVANLTARISELRNLLYDNSLSETSDFVEAGITGITKTDPNGQSFEEYRIIDRAIRVKVSSYLSSLRRPSKVRAA